jgi:hypothetical protein
MENKNQEVAGSQPQNQNPAPVAAPPKKSKKSCLTCGIIGVILIFTLFVFSSAMPFVFPFIGPGLFGSLFDKIVNHDDIFDKAVNKARMVITTAGDGSVAELSVPLTAVPGENKLTFISADRKDYPKDVIGGLYKLEPSGTKFSRALSLKVFLDEDPGKDFALGYWHPETKTWEYLPTVKRGKNIYETVLVHASFEGGYSVVLRVSGAPNAQNGEFNFEFSDPESQQAWEDMKAVLDQQALEMLTQSEAADIDPAVKEGLQKTFSKIAAKSVSNYCENKSPENANDFLEAWAMAGFFGFAEQASFADTWDNQCEEPEKPKTVYIIDQTDDRDIDLGFSDPTGVVKMKSNGTLTTYSGGHTNGKPAGEEIDWKTAWTVYQNCDSKINMDITVAGKDGPSYFDTSARNATGTANDRLMLTFNITGIKEGQTFPILITRFMNSQQNISIPAQKQVIHFVDEDGNVMVHYEQNVGANESEETPAGATWNATGTLVKDKREGGAIISYEWVPTPEQKAQLEQIKALSLQAPPSLRGLLDDNGLPKTGSSSTYYLTIIPHTFMEDKSGSEESDSQADNASNDNSGEQKGNKQTIENENDKDGDGLPDLVPLPGSNQ